MSWALCLPGEEARTELAPAEYREGPWVGSGCRDREKQAIQRSRDNLHNRVSRGPEGGKLNYICLAKRKAVVKTAGCPLFSQASLVKIPHVILAEKLHFPGYFAVRSSQ